MTIIIFFQLTDEAHGIWESARYLRSFPPSRFFNPFHIYMLPVDSMAGTAIIVLSRGQTISSTNSNWLGLCRLELRHAARAAPVWGLLIPGSNRMLQPRPPSAQTPGKLQRQFLGRSIGLFCVFSSQGLRCRHANRVVKGHLTWFGTRLRCQRAFFLVVHSNVNVTWRYLH